MAAQVVATVVLVFRGSHFKSAKLGSCPGAAITAATQEVARALKNAFPKAALNHEGKATIHVEFNGKKLEGNGTGRRPGLAITAATDEIMRKARGIFPKNKRPRRQHLELTRGDPLPAS